MILAAPLWPQKEWLADHLTLLVEEPLELLMYFCRQCFFSSGQSLIPVAVTTVCSDRILTFGIRSIRSPAKGGTGYYKAVNYNPGS